MIAFNLLWPAAWMSRMIGRTLAANCAACALRAACIRFTTSAAVARPRSRQRDNDARLQTTCRPDPVGRILARVRTRARVAVWTS